MVILGPEKAAVRSMMRGRQRSTRAREQVATVIEVRHAEALSQQCIRYAGQTTTLRPSCHCTTGMRCPIWRPVVGSIL